VKRRLKRLFCDHEFAFVRNIYGDEIIASGYKRSEWICPTCGKRKFRETLYRGDQ